MGDLYIGLMSGTSMDGIDAVLVDFAAQPLSLLCTHKHPYPDEVQQRLQAAVSNPAHCGLDQLGQLHVAVGECFRDAALALLNKAGLASGAVRAIGSHGQTLRHRPDATRRFSLQIGDAASIAIGTGIDTVADFRSSDLAVLGEGAPLVPRFHAWLFRDASEHRVVLNLGGIGNITILPANDDPARGFDTGPANTLLDAWSRKIRHQPLDRDGQWAASGVADRDLIEQMLSDPWFSLAPPKSTGLEYFNLDWLERLPIGRLRPEDIQASLAELTACSIASAIHRWAPDTANVYVCGGGVNNTDLMQRLARLLSPAGVTSTHDAGLDPEWVEAVAFAWLARRRIHGLPGNLPAVTGAHREAILGAVYAH